MMTITIMMAMPLIASAEEPTLKWDASIGDVTGYIIYYGVAEGVYSFNEDVGNITELPEMITVLGLNQEVQYWFAIRAYNVTGESGLSNAVTYTTPAIIIPPWVPPENINPVPIPPVIIEVPDTVRQLILNFSSN